MSWNLFFSGPGGDDSEARASLFNLQVDYDSLQDKYDILLNEKVLLDKEIEEFRSRIGEIEQELGKSDCSGCFFVSILYNDNATNFSILSEWSPLGTHWGVCSGFGIGHVHVHCTYCVYDKCV